MNKPLKIAVAGLGTVGVGLVRLLGERCEALAQQCGRAITITAVSARDKSKDRGVDLQGIAWFDNAEAMAREADAERAASSGREIPCRS